MALLAAQVSASGLINFGSGATGAQRLTPGDYEVQFNRNVERCFYNAVSFSETRPIFAQSRAGNPNGVFIRFVNNAGTPVESHST